MRTFYRHKRILVTGGTGSIGSEIVRQLLTHSPAVVRVFSRDDSKQADLEQRLGRNPRLRYLIGDVRDRYRLKHAMQGIDVVFHAAALKHVPTCEYNPFEAVQTNAIGTQNVVQAALDAGVARVVAISTDKAVNPVNTMGASKLLAERITVAAGQSIKHTRLCAVRFGNVVGSRGSLVPLIDGQLSRGGPVTVTDPDMTRFMMTIPDAVRLVLQAGVSTKGGEVFILKMPAVRVGDFVRAAIGLLAPRHGLRPSAVRRTTIGARAGEKRHEELLTLEELPRTRDLGAMLVVSPPWRPSKAKAPPARQIWLSDAAAHLGQDDLRKLLKRSGVV